MKAVSIIIPVYNEEELLELQIEALISKLKSYSKTLKYEIVLVENGSTDETHQIALKLAKIHQNILVYRNYTSSYGQATKTGFKHASYDILALFDIDFWSVDFLNKSIALLNQYDIVIGSKNLPESYDERPLMRKLLSSAMEKFTKFVFKINITDTHGLKVMKKELIEKLIDKVESPNHFFDTELLTRAYYAGYKFIELPVKIKEIRQSRFPLYKRSIEAFFELFILLRLKKYITQYVNVRSRRLWTKFTG